MSVIIKEVQSRKDLRDFVRFPIRLYKDCPHYVPNLYLDEMHALTEKNPMTRYSKTAKFLAYKDGELCGRVMAIINEIANRDWNHAEVRLAPSVSRILTTKAASWKGSTTSVPSC